ncbi:MAG: metal-sensing transcriptional repressor [Gammaproteobacteria bacterium]|nr:metal-sensing transcriptional repressor [Gammaproteobacteria bacterium]
MEHKYKSHERDPQELGNLKSRLKKINGQVNGISKMLDENRYCADILTQISAIESALKEVGYIILNTHLHTCVKEDILNGKDSTIDEAMTVIKRLK